MGRWLSALRARNFSEKCQTVTVKTDKTPSREVLSVSSLPVRSVSQKSAPGSVGFVSASPEDFQKRGTRRSRVKALLKIGMRFSTNALASASSTVVCGARMPRRLPCRTPSRRSAPDRQSAGGDHVNVTFRANPVPTCRVQPALSGQTRRSKHNESAPGRSNQTRAQHYTNRASVHCR